MVYYTREQIRSFIRCPQLGSTDYGEWGALRLEQRLAINSMLDQLDSAEVYIRQLEKENKELKFENILAREENDYLHKNYIPKSEIKKKIEELENKKDITDNQAYNFKEVMEAVISGLQDFLR